MAGRMSVPGQGHPLGQPLGDLFTRRLARPSRYAPGGLYRSNSKRLQPWWRFRADSAPRRQAMIPPARRAGGSRAAGWRTGAALLPRRGCGPQAARGRGVLPLSSPPRQLGYGDIGRHARHVQGRTLLSCGLQVKQLAVAAPDPDTPLGPCLAQESGQLLPRFRIGVRLHSHTSTTSRPTAPAARASRLSNVSSGSRRACAASST